ncbi:MAG TPA: phytoene/squalene synthase family protein [Bryobacteraceae bacterium]|nr:phytoene/squalene synthase family protein [Bryobacteraceae bacterium]
MTDLETSYATCRRIAKSRARNFYYSFVLLPKAQRNAICAIYAFMRHCDDLSDDPQAGVNPQQAIEAWRVEMDAALDGRFGENPLWPAFHDTAQRYKIPPVYFHEMIEGVLSDLGPRRIQTFDELYRYCYQVASVVGLTVIHIFGFKGADALPLAEKCGVAFQLTNILRDVREDAGRDRVYLPAEDLERFHVEVRDLAEGKRTDEFVALLEFEAHRARAYYTEAEPLVDMVDPHSRASLWALIEIYSRLLGRIEKTNYDVLSYRVELSGREKLRIILRAAVGGR